MLDVLRLHEPSLVSWSVLEGVLDHPLVRNHLIFQDDLLLLFLVVVLSGVDLLDLGGNQDLLALLPSLVVVVRDQASLVGRLVRALAGFSQRNVGVELICILELLLTHCLSHSWRWGSQPFLGS